MIRKVTFIGLTLFMLTGCSTVIDNSGQEITLLAPGTGGALCLLERPGYRERVWTPKTIYITKSRDPIHVSCVAPGNRAKEFYLKPKKEHSGYWNIATLGLGQLYDAETGAMYHYPEKLVLDFSDTPVTPQPLPEYQRLLAENPELAGMEEFRPGVAALPDDTTEAPHTLQPRTAADEQGLSDGLQDEDAIVQGAPRPADTSTTTSTTSTDKSASGTTSTTTTSTHAHSVGHSASDAGGPPGLIHGQGGSIFDSSTTSTTTTAAPAAMSPDGTPVSTGKSFTTTSTPAPTSTSTTTSSTTTTATTPPASH